MEKVNYENILNPIPFKERESKIEKKPSGSILDFLQGQSYFNDPMKLSNEKIFLNQSILNINLEDYLLKNKIEIIKEKFILPEQLIKKIHIPSLLPNNPVQIQYNPKFVNFNFSALSKPTVTVDTKTRVTADNIAEFAYPLAQFVEQVRPDYIIACDRGARIIGLAVHVLYGKLYGALPTQDHSINFRKISRKVPADAVRAALQPDVKRMLAATQSPTVLVLDDWVSTGGTKSLVHETFDELSDGKVNILYGVMRGGGADVTGSRDSSVFGDWHDRVDLIGIDYSPTDLKRYRVNSRAASDYRRRMSAGINSFVRNLALQSAK